uniref:Integral membrane protein n=1 Tax=Streptomyces sp. NBC_00008 TaxID=2903610 RepID=A0AAU2VWP2_9ACTN
MDHGEHQDPARYESGDGCLTTLIRIPVRIVVLVLVLPVRMVWDALVACARAADRTLLRPLGRALSWLFHVLVAVPAGWLWAWVLTPLGHGLRWLARAVFVWPWTALWRYVVVPGVRYGIVVPLRWLYAAVLTPLGHGLRWVCLTLLAPAGRGVLAGIGWLLRGVLVLPAVGAWRYVLVPLGLAAAWAGRHLVVVPARWVYRELLTPLGRGTAWLLDLLARGVAAGFRGLWAGLRLLVLVLLVTPLVWGYQRVLAPVGREVAAAFGFAWRAAGFVSRAVGRALARLAWYLVGAPVAWAYRMVCAPVGHFVRRAVWAPVRRAAVAAGRTARDTLRTARETVRRARRDAWRALVGGPRVPEPREPDRRVARTLGSTTTVPSAAPEPEISLHGGKPARQG